MAAGRSLPAIRPARPDDASFIARNILSSQRGPLPRGWFDIALGWGEPQCLDFVERIAVVANAILVARLAIHHRRSRWQAGGLAVRLAGFRHRPRCESGDRSGGRRERAWRIEVAAIFRRGAYTRNCWVQGGEGDWLIEHVADAA